MQPSRRSLSSRMLSGKLQPKEQLLSSLGLVATNCGEEHVNSLPSIATVDQNELQERQKTWQKTQSKTFTEGKDGARITADKLLESDVCSPLGCKLMHCIETQLNRYPLATTILDRTKTEKFCSTPVDICNQSTEADRLPRPSLRPRNQLQHSVTSYQYRLKMKGYCHTYHFTRQQRIDFCQTFDYGLNARARNLYKKVKPCSILLQRIPAMPSSGKENYNAISPSSCHVPNGGDRTLLQANFSSESISEDCVPSARLLKTADLEKYLETEASSLTCTHRDVLERSRVKNTLASVGTKHDQAVVETNAFSSLSFDGSVSFVSLWMAGEKLPSVAFQCDICSEVMCCDEDSKTSIEVHFAGHGICNVTVMVEKDALGSVALKIVETDYSVKLPAPPKAQQNDKGSCRQTSPSMANLASTRIGCMSEATIGGFRRVVKAQKRVHWSDQLYSFCDSDFKKSRLDSTVHSEDTDSNSTASHERMLQSLNSDKQSFVMLDSECECVSVKSSTLPQPHPLEPSLTDLEQQKMPPAANDRSVVSQHIRNNSTKSKEQKCHILTDRHFTKAIGEADDYFISTTAVSESKSGALSHDKGIEHHIKDNQNRPPVPVDGLDNRLATDIFTSPKEDRLPANRSSSSRNNVLSNLAQYQRQTSNCENEQGNKHQTAGSTLVHVLREFMSQQPDTAKSLLTSIIAASTQPQPVQQQKTSTNNFRWYSPAKNSFDEPSVFTQVSQKATYQSVSDSDVICLD